MTDQFEQIVREHEAVDIEDIRQYAEDFDLLDEENHISMLLDAHNRVTALIQMVRELRGERDDLERQVGRHKFDNALMSEEYAIRSDRAYLDGLREGWNLGISNNETRYYAAVDGRSRLIVEALNKHEHGGQPK